MAAPSREKLNRLLERMWKELEMLEQLEQINPVMRQHQFKKR